MFASCINALVLISVFFVPESPKFLIGKKKFKDARKSLARIAKINKKSENLAYGIRFENELKASTVVDTNIAQTVSCVDENSLSL